ncbi:MAG: hypothetical protein ACRDTC_02110 [Pseudonocardiaceae bacterium]
MLRPLRPWLPSLLPWRVPFRLRVWWAWALGNGLPQRWGYIVDVRPRWRRVWSCLTRRLHKPEQLDRSDGRDYRGWTARVVADDEGILPVGVRGPVVGSERCRGGELRHTIELPDHTLTTPLPWLGIELIKPDDTT